VLVEISSLRAGYGGAAVVSIDELNISPSEHTLVLGPSGCGKTTLLNVLAGLSLPISGGVKIEGRDITQLSASARDKFRGERIGLVMQRLHLISALSVFDNLKLAQRLAGRTLDVARIDETLRTLGIEDKAKKYPRNLSQGEAQRVAIARAVINRPALILADEPTSALDDTHCEAAIALLFTQAAQYGATLIVATHDARIKPRFARVVTLPSPASAHT
jgi:putative ABC transport system ATP-binding protein